MRNCRKYLLLSLAVAGILFAVCTGASAQPGVVGHTGTLGDGLVVVQNERAYRDVVREEGNERFLRETFVARAGHCAFTPAETITAVQALLKRLDTGRWGPLEVTDLNNNAEGLGPSFNIFGSPTGGIVPVAPAFVKFAPNQYLRPFDAGDKDQDKD
jgi:hypothetical protein